MQLSKIFGDTPITKYEINFPGDYGGEATPVPIPNTAVKLSSADGTALTCGRVGRCQDLIFSEKTSLLTEYMRDKRPIYLMPAGRGQIEIQSELERRTVYTLRVLLMFAKLKTKVAM